MDVIGMQELMLVAFVALLVIGPERLPEVLRTLGLWFGRMRRSFLSVKTEIEKEIGMDEIRRQLHNEAVMEEMKRIEEEVHNSIDPHTSEADKDHTDAGADDFEPPNSTELADAEVNDSAEPATESVATESIEEAPPPRPVSEAELEAMHAARQKKAARERAEADAKQSIEKSN